MFFLFSKAAPETTGPLKIKAPHVLIIDYQSQDVIVERDADAKTYPASMTKIMTALVIFEALKNKQITLETMLTVPKAAYRAPGTSMFLKLGQKVSVFDLLKGLICVSGNDAAKTLAIALAGSEENFAELMNDMAVRIGAANTHFTNASGLFHKEHYTTARDLIKITHYLITNFPEYYYLFKQKTFNFNGVLQTSKNSLLKNDWFDGVKPGFDDSYGTVVSMVNPETKRRILVFANGYHSERDREWDVERMARFAMYQTKAYCFLEEGATAHKIPVLFGDKRSVDLGAKTPVCVTLGMNSEEPTCNITIAKKYLKGPVDKGTPVGIATIKTSNGEKTYTLYTKEDVKKGSWARYAVDYVKALFY
ncbi:MAG: D-alanyl-D-alanine carboxypeptidase [Alphaproteobacteria bacterium]|nr:MAG: D-alanyl-D-alanine carboxypeptidase [Alphaproteobacteria bacterium]